MRAFPLILLVSIGLTGATASAKNIKVDLSFSRANQLVCKSRFVVEPKETYLVCGSEGAGQSHLLKMTAEPFGERQFKISAVVEDVLPDGKIATISSPTIVALEEEPAEISQSDTDGRVVMELKVRATVAN